jgi:hypothetical protein
VTPVASRSIVRGLPGRQVLTVVGLVGMVVGAALPWFGTGPVKRSAFTLIRVANELEVFENRLHRVGVSALLITPLLTGFVIVCLGLRWQKAAGLFALLCALLGVVAGGFGTRISGGSAIGPIVTLIAALAAAIGGGSLFRAPRPDHGIGTINDISTSVVR